MRKKRRRKARLIVFAALILIAALAASVTAGGLISAVLANRHPGEDTVLIREGGDADGRLRVQMRSLGNPPALTLTLAGDYAVDGDGAFRLARGSVVEVAEQRGSIWMRCGGVTLNMGAQFTLTRTKAPDGEENGLYIAESEKANLYMGDLHLTAADGGLSALLYIDIEDYLCGVVPYEMSDSWPLEALKAQAVAARTYALQRKSARAAQDYDVADTTADQVFKGFCADYTNAIAAVEATCGVVGMYKGSLATCYYGASNGGQSAMPDEIWGRSGDYGYLAVIDDPYDLENPLSVTRAITIQANGEEIDDALAVLLKAAIAEQMAALGFSEDAEDIRIGAIEAVEPIACKGRPGSRMVETLRFTIRVEGRKWIENTLSEVAPAAPLETPAPGDTLSPTEPPATLGAFVPLDEPLAADIGTYSQLKAAFPTLAINKADYELYSVVAVYSDKTEEVIASAATPIPTIVPSTNQEPTEVSSVDPTAAPTIAPDAPGIVAWRIEGRRFGHGVGMSQRGAQIMAGKHGAPYTDILMFYYPGMELARYTIAGADLQELEDLPQTLGAARVLDADAPRSTPSPLPALRDGERYATVVLSSNSSALNVRKEPNTLCDILGTLSNGQRVILSETFVDWAYIRTAEVEGYVALEYLKSE